MDTVADNLHRRTMNWSAFLCVLVFLATVGLSKSQNCSEEQFFDENVRMCFNCTVCATLNREELSPCSNSSNTTCQPCADGQFLDQSTQRCRRCTECEPFERETGACTEEHDRTCLRECADRYFYIPEEDTCIVDCRECPNARCARDDTQRCECLQESCYNTESDPFCERLLPECESPVTPTDVSAPPPDSSSGSNELPSWGIGLIAVGIVSGIVAFSGCFLLMGCFTRRDGNLDIGSEESAKSNSGLIVRASLSSSGGTHASYIPNKSSLFNNSLEMLRPSPIISMQRGSARNSFSSVKTSPHSQRGSPARTDASDQTRRSSGSGFKVERTDPNDRIGRGSPADRLGRASPADRLGQASLADRLGRASPADRLGRASPGDKIGRASSGDKIGRASSGDKIGRASSGDKIGRASSGDRMGRSGRNSRTDRIDRAIPSNRHGRSSNAATPV